MRLTAAGVCALWAGLSFAFAVAPSQAEQSDEPLALELSIVGTSVEVDERGLPRRLEGDVFQRSGRSHGKYVGTYYEDVEPIIDPVKGFIGTNGVSTFTFHLGPMTVGTLTTRNQSFFVPDSHDPSTGRARVASEGRVTAGTQCFRDRKGKLKSLSTISLGNQFDLNVDLSLTLSRETEEPVIVRSASQRYKSRAAVRYCGRNKRGLIARMRRRSR